MRIEIDLRDFDYNTLILALVSFIGYLTEECGDVERARAEEYMEAKSPEYWKEIQRFKARYIASLQKAIPKADPTDKTENE